MGDPGGADVGRIGSWLTRLRRPGESDESRLSFSNRTQFKTSYWLRNYAERSGWKHKESRPPEQTENSSALLELVI